jgi:HD-GYP domain-containing protein (c-di-GMP phosphodiesterase class II)/CHASE2 domain-containing sensor protein
MALVRRPPWGILSFLAVTLVAVLGVATGGVPALQRPAADALVRLAARHPPASAPGLPDVALVAIDPQSLRAFPDWPWPRRLYAETIRRLDAAGARSVAFDIDLSTPRDAQDDAELARAAAESGRVVLAAFRQLQKLPGGAELEVANLPTPGLAAAAAALGSVLVPVDPDGVVRHASRASSIAGEPLRSLAGAALDVALGQPPQPEPPGSVIQIDYRRAEPPIPHIPIVDVIEGRFDPRDVAGRIVLVGATAAEFQDLWSTVWIQALALRTLAAERAGLHTLATARAPTQLAWLALLSLAAAALATAPPRRRLAGLGLLACGVPAASALLVVSRGVLLDPLLPLAVIGAHYALGLEVVRSRFGRRLAEHDLSLSMLHRVGEATVGPGSRDGLRLALGLLGDVVDACGVALLGAGADGELDGQRLEWRRRGRGAIGDEATAAAVLGEQRSRVFQGRLPGAGARRGHAVYLPLFAGRVPVGVLVVEREGSAPLDGTQMRTIATVGAQMALSAENLRLIAELRSTFDSSVEAIASAVEARDGYTESHCRRLAIFSVSMANRLGLPGDEVEAIRLGALLHDVGKIGIRDEVLLKPGRFTPEERVAMQAHTEIGHRIVTPILGLSPTTLACVRGHHERWDGGGYPDRLAGHEIPLGARIVSVVDVWDALSTERPYKPAYPQERVLDILYKGRGVQFDPEMVDLFLRVLEEEGEEMRALVERSGTEGA